MDNQKIYNNAISGLEKGWTEYKKSADVFKQLIDESETEEELSIKLSRLINQLQTIKISL